jgi:hypothetical protein
MHTLKRLGLSACFLFFACASYAQEIDLVGRTGWYHYTRRLLAIYADMVQNTRPTTTDYLFLTVHATTEPSGGNFIGSYVIGSIALGQLEGNWSTTDVERLARFNPPPPGLYYTSIVLEEYNRGAYEAIDWEDLEGIVNFGTWGQAFGTGLGANGDLYFEGDVYWISENGLVQLYSDLIANDRATKSGPLRLRLYATEAPYDGAELNGTLMATKNLGRFKSGGGFQNYSRIARFVPPSVEGTYYTVLTLEERVGRIWYIMDYVVFPEASIF